MSKLEVEDLMTPRVFSVLPDDDLLVVRRLMRGWRVRHAPVIDEAGALLGIVSERDLLRHTLLGRPGASQEEVERSLELRRVEEIMIPGVESARLDEEIGDAAERMLESKLGCLPVVDARGHLVGLLTEGDFVRWFSEGRHRARAHQVAAPAPA